MATPLAVRLYGGRGYDAAHGVARLPDGTLVVVGETSSYDGDARERRRDRGRDDDPADIWIAHMDADGTVRRQLTWGGRQHDVAYAVAATRDGGYVVAGAASSRGKGHHGDEGMSDFVVLRYDSEDRLLWQRRIGGTDDDGYRDDYDAMSVVEAADGGIVFIGNTFSDDDDFEGLHHACAGTRDIAVVKLGEDGHTQWVKSLGGRNHEYASQIVRSADGGYLVVGRTESYEIEGFKGEYDAWVVKLDARGEPRWSRTLGGELWDWGSALAPLPDGGALFCGYTYSSDDDGEGNQGDYDVLVARLGPNGGVQWRRVYGGMVDDFGQAIVPLPDGRFMVAAGSASSDGAVGANRGSFDLWCFTISDKGELLSRADIGGTEYEINAVGAGSLLLPDGCVVVVGTTRSNDGDMQGNHGDYDAFVAWIDPDRLTPATATPSATRAEGRRGGAMGGHHGEATQVASPLRTPGRAPAVAWQRTLGGSAADRPQDAPQSLAVKREGGCVVVGSTRSRDGDVTRNRGDWDAWIVNLDAEGRIVWQKTFGGSGRDIGTAVAQAPDGGFAFVATTGSRDGDVKGAKGATDLWVVRIDRSGAVKWTRTLGGSGPEIASSIASTADGGFVVGGYTQSLDGDVHHAICAWDFWIVKLGPDGRTEWERSLGGSSNEYLVEVKPVRSGGYVAIGRTESQDGQVSENHGTYDYWLVRLDAQGKVVWEKSYGSWDWEWGNAVAETRDGGFVIGGYTYTFDDFDGGQVSANHGEFDYWMVKVDADGELEWERSFGGSNYELGYGIVQTRDGGYAMIGGSPSTDGQVSGNHGMWDVWVIKTDGRGRLLWEKSLGGREYDAGYAIAEDRDGGLLLLGESYSSDGDVKGTHGDEDMWVVKLRP